MKLWRGKQTKIPPLTQYLIEIVTPPTHKYTDHLNSLLLFLPLPTVNHLVFQMPC